MAQVSGQSWGHATRTTEGADALMQSLYVDELDPMPHRRAARRLQVREAADVRGGDDVGATGLERAELAGAQLARDFRVQQRVGAGGPAAEMRVVHRLERVSGRGQQRLDLAADLLAVLQRARRLERHNLPLS